MADKSSRTEKGTAKHRKEMREKGSVARSPEIGGWAALLAVVLLLPWMGTLAVNRINGFVQDVVQAMAHPDPARAVAILGQGLLTAAFAALPTLLVGSAVGLALAVAQVGLRITPKALNFQLSRISPKNGLHRLFSSQGFWTLGKTLLKIAVLAVVSYGILNHLVHSVLGGATLPLQTTLLATESTVSRLMRFIGGLSLVIAGADYFFLRRTHNQDLRMTKQEVRNERRESDGNPEVRQTLRNKARQLSRMHMMAAVARADAVVTNPTHFAVAIAYDRQRDRAPRVVAKGADFNAIAIREHARRCGVVLVENPILARALHASCEVDDVVPPGLYTAVAQLLAFVYSLSPTARVYRDVHQMVG
ncbi:MAG TPA: EscU/YscU/HrcU family type III secretion system export apparatus switch protein [Candidatus Paceibacterota bacterium]|nr:EscU/YscU/HrcU family type III secretion system export apparatus switch protein [Candidatus Paceibacterota bacterium]